MPVPPRDRPVENGMGFQPMKSVEQNHGLEAHATLFMARMACHLPGSFAARGSKHAPLTKRIF
jgi:hypothetical protein